ncbi:hypothetical protein DFH09DRAFT_1076354 [Mycena vulgaris]|nr:hypothetical protein DFH09DRAFT_1076354 [Mycena vulgaris]
MAARHPHIRIIQDYPGPARIKVVWIKSEDIRMWWVASETRSLAQRQSEPVQRVWKRDAGGQHEVALKLPFLFDEVADWRLVRKAGYMKDVKIDGGNALITPILPAPHTHSPSEKQNFHSHRAVTLRDPVVPIRVRPVTCVLDRRVDCFPSLLNNWTQPLTISLAQFTNLGVEKDSPPLLEEEALGAEFGRSIAWFQKNSSIWEYIAEEGTEEEADWRAYAYKQAAMYRGAYAYKQAAMYRGFAEHCVQQWGNVPALVAEDLRVEEEKQRLAAKAAAEKGEESDDYAARDDDPAIGAKRPLIGHRILHSRGVCRARTGIELRNGRGGQLRRRIIYSLGRAGNALCHNCDGRDATRPVTLCHFVLPSCVPLPHSLNRCAAAPRE